MRIGLLWRAEWDPPRSEPPSPEETRLRGVFAAFSELGVSAEPVVYSDETADAARAHLLELDGVLVWVNPIQDGRDRSRLDPLLEEVARRGVWVSAHPDVIRRMATKKVLVDTRSMSWGSDTRLYDHRDQLRGLGGRLGARGAVVLKQLRGMGGEGVWKVSADPSGSGLVVEHAGDGWTSTLAEPDLVDRLAAYLGDGGMLIEQPYLERISDGMIRCYLTHDRVVGFAHQYPRGLRPVEAGEPPPGKQFELADVPRFADLRRTMEGEWVGQLQRIVGVSTDELPVIWDADFLYGPTTAEGADTYVLCEINASSTFAFPEHAMRGVAEASLRQVTLRRSGPRRPTRS